MLQKVKKNRGENVISEMAEALKNKGCEFPRPHSKTKWLSGRNFYNVPSQKTVNKWVKGLKY